MRNPRTITIIKLQSGLRQVQFAGLALGEFSIVEKAKDFAMNYEFGKTIEVWIDGECEVFDK